MPSRRCASASRLAVNGTNSANAWRSCMPFSHGASSARRCTVSSLLAIRNTGLPASFDADTSASTFASSSPKRPASTTNSTTSTSASTPCTVRFKVRFRAAPCCVWKPGVSTKTNCESPSVRMPVMRCRVVCALADVMLIFCPTSALSKVDLPTFGRPTMATSPQRCGCAAGSGRSGSGAVIVVNQERKGLPGASVDFSASSMRRAASCSATRRERPSPICCRPSAGTSQATSKVCAWAWPRVALMR